MRLDIKTKQTKFWEEEDCIPSEPVFVARPGGTEEDDGNWRTVSINLLSTSHLESEIYVLREHNGKHHQLVGKELTF